MKKKIKYIILLFIVLGLFSKFVESSQDEFPLIMISISNDESMHEDDTYFTKQDRCNLSITGHPDTDKGKKVYISIKPENKDFETNTTVRLGDSGDADYKLSLEENIDYKIEAYTNLKGNKPKKDAKPVKTIKVRFDKKSFDELDKKINKKN